MKKTLTQTLAFTATLILAPCFAEMAHAQSTAFTYQGRLEEAAAPANGAYDFRFGLFGAAVNGVQVGEALCLNDVDVEKGLFTVVLDFGQQFATTAERHLEVEVRQDTGLNCSSLQDFVALAPRQQLTAVPQALYSLDADRLGGLDSTAYLQSIPNPLTVSGTSPAHIIRGENASTAANSVAVFGLASGASGTNRGVYGGTLSPNGAGVMGEATTGPAAGVFGFSSSTSGFGLYGWANAASGTTRGVYGQSNSPNGVGVAGRALAITGPAFGVHGMTSSVSGSGVFGVVGLPNGLTTGVWGQVTSNEGRGVYGQAFAPSGPTFGVWGETASSSGVGVRGLASADSGTTYGVRGQVNSSVGYAGYFEGGRNYFEGNVGIGTGDPIAKLDVRGDIRLGSSGEVFAPGGQESLRLVRGNVDGDGTILAGTGFTSQRLSEGKYHIVFNPAFSVAGGNPSATVTAHRPLGGAGRMAQIESIFTNGMTISVQFIGSSAFTDSDFSFCVMGRR